MSEWQPTIIKDEAGTRWGAPERKEVETKIDDAHGERNVAPLTRMGNLWYTSTADGLGMYVYYTPTHWRPL